MGILLQFGFPQAFGGEIVPDGNGHEWRAFFPDDSAVQALERRNEEGQEMGSDVGGECLVERCGQNAPEKVREAIWPIFKNAPGGELLSSLNVREEDD